MNASPFWKRIMALLGILCMLTLILPSVYYVKYIALDYPREQRIAKFYTLPAGKAAAPGVNKSGPAVSAVEIDDVRWYMSVATTDKDPYWRSWAVSRLTQMCGLPGAQVLHWMECLNAKLTIEQVRHTDTDPTVVAQAASSLAKLGQAGVTFSR